MCSNEDTPATVGDEPYMIYEKYQDAISVVVCEDRALAIPFILAERPETQVILLDDAFQHRTVLPDLNLLLTKQSAPFWTDYLMPLGKLREARGGAKRADAIVITRAKRISEEPYIDALGKPYFYTTTRSNEVQLFSGQELLPKVVAVAGLADNKHFFQEARQHFQVQRVFSFRDHHSYKHKDVQVICAELDEDTMLITTHKDAVKLKQFAELRAYTCGYVPVEVVFLEGEERFLQMVDKCIESIEVNH